MIRKLIDYYRKGGVTEVYYAFLRSIGNRVFARFLAVYYNRSKPKYGLNKDEYRPKKIIISLTSHDARFGTLHICIKTLLRQTSKPDKILLYLYKDIKLEDINKKILDLLPYGLEIVKCDEDLKPHKKYFYVMQQYPDDIIITVDDDIMYNKNLVKSLMLSYYKYPKSISAKRVIKYITDTNGDILPLQDCYVHCRSILKPSMQLHACGGGGVLYPPLSNKLMHNDLFNIELIKKFCLTADDVWLKIMQIRANTPVTWASPVDLQKNIPGSRKTALSRTHTKNEPYYGDFVIKLLQEFYKIKISNYFSLNDLSDNYYKK